MSERMTPERLAGRELDVMVAEKVMGWTNVRLNDEGFDRGLPPNGERRHDVPNYSTDIAAAWLVVDMMRLSTSHFECGSVRDGHARDWFACFWKAGCYRSRIVEQAPFAQAAICRAALAAVGAA